MTGVQDYGDGPVLSVGPHKFTPLAWHDRTGVWGRCRACYLPRHAHPTTRWDPARPIGVRWGVRWPFRRPSLMP